MIMTTKKPNFIVKFDNSNPTEEERAKAICDLILCLMKLSVRQEAKKLKRKKSKKNMNKNFLILPQNPYIAITLTTKNNKIMFELLKLSLLLRFNDCLLLVSTLFEQVQSQKAAF